jgi:putative endonuclease
MKPIGCHNYFVYIITNKNKTVLYIGVTNDLKRRLYEHEQNIVNHQRSFAARYNCRYLLYWERSEYIEHAIAREKELKGWRREKKVSLINGFNAEWHFLNERIE